MPDNVEALAQHIRRMWVEERRDFEMRTKGITSDWGSRPMKRYDGGRDEDGKFYKPIWPKIAQFVLENDLDPDTLIHAVFYQKIDQAPAPNNALGPTALEKYNKYVAPATRMEIRTELIHALESQKQKALAEIASKVNYYKLDEQRAWRIAVGSPSIPLTPLFRFCVSTNQGWADVAEEYRFRALRQYRRYADLYDDVWGDWIPGSFKAEAKTKKGG